MVGIEPRLFMTPFGGHGTTFLFRRFAGAGISVCVRPDTVFGDECMLDGRPDSSMSSEWKKRTGRDLLMDQTINRNLMNLIEEEKKFVMLCGRCSARDKFLSRNNLRVWGLVRHPVLAYCSYLGRRHPEHAKRFGGIDTLEAAEWYSGLWSNIVEDLFESSSYLTRFESLLEDLNSLQWKKTLRMLSGWKAHLRDIEPISDEVINVFRERLEDKVNAIYGRWAWQ